MRSGFMGRLGCDLKLGVPTGLGREISLDVFWDPWDRAAKAGQGCGGNARGDRPLVAARGDWLEIWDKAEKLMITKATVINHTRVRNNMSVA
jgi:hypothetical protein